MNAEKKTYPVNIRGELTVPPGPGWWLLKWLLGIPHYILLFFLWVAFIIVCIVAFFNILFTGKYPKSLFQFNEGVLRWSWRVCFYSYGALGTDKYPPFSLDPDPDYPADLEIAYPEKLSSGLVLVKWWLLAIPHYIIVSIFVGGMSWGCTGDWNGWSCNGDWNGGGTSLIFILAIFAGVVLLFTSKYPQEIFKLVVGFNRWSIRVAAYASLMTDAYPPFRLWDD
ncbi:MAG TPA: DUF4389 domain-containing protein [Dehalococcoidia bacterium]|nr:DUF4389 domain-containing protein [Dehalococcoidia bacterium]